MVGILHKLRSFFCSTKPTLNICSVQGVLHRSPKRKRTAYAMRFLFGGQRCFILLISYPITAVLSQYGINESALKKKIVQSSSTFFVNTTSSVSGENVPIAASVILPFSS